jgi:purine-binding chemotaxis protein CheW
MTNNYLVFLLSGRLFGARLSGAIEILPWRQPREVPLAFSYVQGLIDYRGTIYPVFNLSLRMGMSKQGPIGFTAETKSQTSAGQSIILVEENGAPFGITVDSVVKMSMMEETAATADKIQGIEPRYVKAIVYDDDQEIMILDFERLLHAG